MTVLPPIPDDYRTRLPQIREEDTRIRWHCRYYDGPRSGVLLYRGSPCWFENRDQDSALRQRVDEDGVTWDDWYQRFLLIELTDEQYRELARRNDLFREKVGTHWDYDENGRRRGGTVRPEEMWHAFYELAETWEAVDLSHSRVLGWTERRWASAEVEGGPQSVQPGESQAV